MTQETSTGKIKQDKSENKKVVRGKTSIGSSPKRSNSISKGFSIFSRRQSSFKSSSKHKINNGDSESSATDTLQTDEG